MPIPKLPLVVALGGKVSQVDRAVSDRKEARVTFSDLIEEIAPSDEGDEHTVYIKERKDKQNLDRNQRKKRKKLIRSRSTKFVGNSVCDVLLKIRGIDELVVAFTDGGCLGLNTCPRELFTRYFSGLTTGIRCSAPASDYQGNTVVTLGEFEICIDEIYGFKTRTPLGRKKKWITLTTTETVHGRISAKKVMALKLCLRHFG